MNMMIDVTLAVMLALVLVGGAVMTRRLTAFRESREDLARLVASLSGAVDKAHAAIAELKSASDSAEVTLAKRLGEVRRLGEEVATMREAGEKLARRLEFTATVPRSGEESAAHGPRASEKPPTRAERFTGLAAQIAALDAARLRTQRAPGR